MKKPPPAIGGEGDCDHEEKDLAAALDTLGSDPVGRFPALNHGPAASFAGFDDDATLAALFKTVTTAPFVKSVAIALTADSYAIGADLQVDLSDDDALIGLSGLAWNDGGTYQTQASDE